MSTQTAPTCECGCGDPVSTSKKDRPDRGLKAGDYVRFRKGHFPVKPLRERFDAKYKVDERGCWIWRGATLANDYGTIVDHGKQLLAHRVSYMLHVGPIPDGLVIDHLCRTKRCVNPKHLDPVPQKVNARRGIKTVLTFEQAKYVARMRGVHTAKELAAEFGTVTPSAIRSIWRGHTWRDATAEVAAQSAWLADWHTQEVSDD